MFKLSSELTFPWPVKVIEPDPKKAGKLVEHEFTAIFAILDPEAVEASLAARRAILAKMHPESTLEELKAVDEELTVHDRAALFEILRGWGDDFIDADEKPIRFTQAMFNEVIKHKRVRNGLIRAYEEAISEDKARLGN